MRSNSSPPKYGAEGPPGGPEAWNQQRFNQHPPKNIWARAGQALASMPQIAERRQARQQQMSQPRPWGEVPRMQWGQQPGPAAPPPAQSLPMQPQGEAGGFTAWGQPAGTVPQGQGAPSMPPKQPLQGAAGIGGMARLAYDRLRAQPAQGQAQPQAPTSNPLINALRNRP